MSNRDAYQAVMEQKLDKWTQRLAVLLADAGDPEQTRLCGWRTRGDAARAKLAELKTATGNRWDVVKGQMERAWDGIAAAFDTTADGTAIEPGSAEDTNPSTRITWREHAAVVPDVPVKPEPE